MFLKDKVSNLMVILRKIVYVKVNKGTTSFLCIQKYKVPLSASINLVNMTFTKSILRKQNGKCCLTFNFRK